MAGMPTVAERRQQAPARGAHARGYAVSCLLPVCRGVVLCVVCCGAGDVQQAVYTGPHYPNSSTDEISNSFVGHCAQVRCRLLCLWCTAKGSRCPASRGAASVRAFGRVRATCESLTAAARGIVIARTPGLSQLLRAASHARTQGCLYNIELDPLEKHDLATAMPAKVASVLPSQSPFYVEMYRVPRHYGVPDYASSACSTLPVHALAIRFIFIV